MKIFKLGMIFSLVLVSNSARSQRLKALDVELDKLEYQRPAGSRGQAGVLEFKRLNLVTPQFRMSLFNNNQIFDAEITRTPDSLGAIGENFEFALETAPGNYLSKIRRAKAYQSQFSFDDQDIEGELTRLEFRDSNNRIKARNLGLRCSTAVEFFPSLIDDLGLSCLSRATIYRLNRKKKVVVEYAQDGGINTYTSFKDLIVEKREIRARDLRSVIRPNKQSVIEVRGGNIQCPKRSRFSRFDFDRLATDCINKADADFTKVDIELPLKKQGQSIGIAVASPVVNIRPQSFTGSFEQVALDIVSKRQIKLGVENVAFKCAKQSPLYPLGDINRIVGECFEELESFAAESFWLDMPAQNDKASVSVKTDIDEIVPSQGQVSVAARNIEVQVDDLSVLHPGQVRANCSQGILNDEQRFDLLWKNCLSEGEYYTEQTRLVQPGKNDIVFIGAQAQSSASQIVGQVNSIVLENTDRSRAFRDIDIKCQLSNAHKIFDYDDLITDCMNNSGEIRLVNFVREKKKGSKGEVDDLERKEKVIFKNLVLSLNKNKMKLELLFNLWITFGRIRLEGDISYQQEGDIITFKLKKARLPLGINSVKFTLFLLRTFVKWEQLRVNGKTIIFSWQK